MSLRLGLLLPLLRHVAKPRIARTETPEEAARDFRRAARLLPAPLGSRRTVRTVAGPGAPLRITRVTCGDAAGDGAILYFHGGAYVAGSAWTHRRLLARLSQAAGLAVEAPDYRLAQEAPLPAAFEDACAAWEAVADSVPPHRIVLGGDSAGGGLALALAAELCARQARPAGAFVFSPWTDLTLSGASFVGNAGADPILPAARVPELVAQILAGTEPADPRVSPLFARFDAPPPVLIQASRTEILLDDAVRMADRLRAAGGEVELDLWPDTPHAWQVGADLLPEARGALMRAAAFARRCLQTAAPASR